jgi:tol-pal system protein YbgF
MTNLKRSFWMAMFVSIAMSAFADQAPVYDVDNFPPQFDGQAEAAVAPGAKPIATATVPTAAVEETTATSLVAPQSLSESQRIARLEQQINNMQASDLTAKLSAMQNDVQSMRGQIEDLTHQVQELQNQQKKMYSDLDKRVSKTLPSSSIPSPSADETLNDNHTGAMAALPADTVRPKAKTKSKTIASAVANNVSMAQPNEAEEQQIYQNAYNLIKTKKYNEAALTLQKMLQKYPSGQFAANAHYWLGELYGLMGKNDQAVTEFGAVVKNYPDSPKIADAHLKLGLIYAAQFKWSDAKNSFKTVVTQFPGTSFAHLAAEQLKQIKTAGH